MNNKNLKHEIMWWMSRLTIMVTSLFLSFSLAAQAYAADIQMGYEGNLVLNQMNLRLMLVIQLPLSIMHYLLITSL